MTVGEAPLATCREPRVLLLDTLLIMIGHSILTPCLDDNAFYNCYRFVSPDGVSLSAGLLALVATGCWASTSPWRDWQ